MVSNFSEACEWTIMHMTGYADNVYTKDIMSDAVACECDVPTLIWMCDYHIKTWGNNQEVEDCINYLEKQL